jgi:hypothetical protein
MVNVLKTREELAYQLALLSTELTESKDNGGAKASYSGRFLE